MVFFEKRSQLGKNWLKEVMIKTLATAPQSFRNGEVHDWYRLVLGYSDHLVAKLIDELGLGTGSSVLDPFCGSGTTAVECLKRGINSWGIDANPSSCFAATVKTTWNVDLKMVRSLKSTVLRSARKLRLTPAKLRKDQAYIYLKNSGMIARGWIKREGIYDAASLKIAIKKHVLNKRCQNLMLLAVVNELVHTSSNVRFGPEIYCSKNSGGGDIFLAFAKKIDAMVYDIELARKCPEAKATIIRGDSRKCEKAWISPPEKGFDALISSPPYPTEHDYTRNARLELVFLEAVIDRESLRAIKRTMIRSHTKGIYRADNDSGSLQNCKKIIRLAAKIDLAAKFKKDGFARLYGRVLREYFGGMRLHFRSILPLLRPGATAAYVVGDQASYFQIPVPTAKLLGDIAEKEGFKLVKITRWRKRWGTVSKKYLDENILFLQAPFAIDELPQKNSCSRKGSCASKSRAIPKPCKRIA